MFSFLPTLSYGFSAFIRFSDIARKKTQFMQLFSQNYSYFTTANNGKSAV